MKVSRYLLSVAEQALEGEPVSGLGRELEKLALDGMALAAVGRIRARSAGAGADKPTPAQIRAAIKAARYPYAGGQKPGCGFPLGKLVAIFSLAGHLVRLAQASWKTHEITLARLLVGWVDEGDVLVADRGFCGWGLIALLRRKNVDVVMRLHQFRADRPGHAVWERPQRPETWEAELWTELPRHLNMRIVRFRV